MKNLFISLLSIFGLGACTSSEPYEENHNYDYEKMVHLDAEELAEDGMVEAYENLLPHLKSYIDKPLILKKVEVDNDDYIVEMNGRRWIIVNENTADSYEGWVNATASFFEVINLQLESSEYRFYAFYGGNDLSGMFLTKDEFDHGRKTLHRESDWPYIPNRD